MANKDYNFQYTPLTGRLPGNSFVKQTEQAINELAGIVNEGAAQVEVITDLANQANDNSEVALEKATEALETSGRVYITLPNLSDADEYFDSQLYYFANSHSANLPVEDTGFLEVKTNDTKTAAEQVFVADTAGLCYFRHGVITSSEVGDETVYSVTWETWSSALASEDYVQKEIVIANNYTDSQVADVNSDVSAINTRLGTILTASGSDTTVNAQVTLCSITTHPAGVFLITSFMDLSYSGTSVYVNNIQTATHGGVTTRNTANSGGGNCAVLLTTLDENETVSLRGYQTQAGTMSGNLKMVQLA